MLESLKQRVFEANLALVKHGLVILTWGNASARDPETGLVVIKPSGVSYDSMKPEDMVIMEPDGRVVEGKFKSSTDAPAHLVIYDRWNSVSGVVHTHSTFAVSWAQAGKPVPAFGTTHADNFYGPVPCTRLLSDDEILSDYEAATGNIIVEALGSANPLTIPGALVNGHGPFCWGESPEKAVHNAVALEEICRMAFNTIMLGKDDPVSQTLLDKHFNRKHGSNAYYGQNENK